MDHLSGYPFPRVPLDYATFGGKNILLKKHTYKTKDIEQKVKCEQNLALGDRIPKVGRHVCD